MLGRLFAGKDGDAIGGLNRAEGEEVGRKHTGVGVVVVVNLGTSLVALEVLVLDLSESNHLDGSSLLKLEVVARNGSSRSRVARKTQNVTTELSSKNRLATTR